MVIKSQTNCPTCGAKCNVGGEGETHYYIPLARQVDLTQDDIEEMALDFILNTGGLPDTIEKWKSSLWKFYQALNKQDE
jgi:hypothetical protein